MEIEAHKLPYFNTLRSESQALLKDRGSSFYAHAFPIEEPKDLESKMEELRLNYKQAGHFCYAYRIHPKQPEVRFSDDGEPSNSAGIPIYNQIAGHDLWNVAVVVARIFGGTKLGVGGLMKAYGGAAKMAFEQADIQREHLRFRAILQFPYSSLSAVYQCLDRCKVQLIDQQMSDVAEVSFEANEQDKSTIFEQIANLHEVKVLLP